MSCQLACVGYTTPEGSASEMCCQERRSTANVSAAGNRLVLLWNACKWQRRVGEAANRELKGFTDQADGLKGSLIVAFTNRIMR